MSGTTPALRVRVVPQQDHVLVLLAGELDLATAARLRTRLATVTTADPPPQRVVLDLSELDFADASGLSVIVSAQKALAVRGGRLVLRRPSRLVKKVLGLLQLDGVLPVEG